MGYGKSMLLPYIAPHFKFKMAEAFLTYIKVMTRKKSTQIF